MNTQALALFCFVAVAIGGVAWVFLYPILSGERKADQRRENIARQPPATSRAGARAAAAAAGRGPQKSRREQVEETLKAIDVKAQKPKSPPPAMRIEQAGLKWTKQRFI